MNDLDDTQPGDRIARIEAKLETIAASLKGPATEEYSDDISAEFRVSKTGNHIEFLTHGPFWSKLFLLGWKRATATRKFNLVAGAIGGQGAIIWVVELAKHWLAHYGAR